MSILLHRYSSQPLFSPSQRSFWSWLNIIWNKYDRKRVQEVGADRACAEWLLRCGGSVRFKNWGSLTMDYNAIPGGAPGQFKIEEIRAIKACITSQGFAYLNGLTDLKRIHLEQCDEVGDSAIARCNQVKESLESMALIDLVQLTDKGLAYISGLKNLKQIDLARLPGIKNRDAVLRLLKAELPQCTINYDDNYPPAPELKDK